MSAKGQEAGLDVNGREVLAFAGEMKNLGRTAALVDLIVEMHGSGNWRSYSTAVGRERWRECEFDYFLIACGASYDEVSRVLAWNRAGKDLVTAMVSEDPTKRRPIEEAAQTWHSPTGEALTERAERQGWTTKRGTFRPPPVPKRAVSIARHGLTMDEQARRRRAEMIPPQRRAQIEKRLGELASDLNEVELRYVRDVITTRLASAQGRPRMDPS